MKVEETGARIRADVKSSGRPYSAELRARVVKYTASQRASGVSIDNTADELGVARATLRSWTARTVFLPPVEVSMAGTSSTVVVVVDEQSRTRIECASAELAIAIVRGLR